MYKNLLRQWIENINEDDLNRYLKANHLWKDEGEAKTLFRLLKEDWEKIYDGDTDTFLKIQKQISEDTYDKLFNLYKMAKTKYKF